MARYTPKSSQLKVEYACSVEVSLWDQHSSGHQSPSVICSRMAPTTISLAPVDRRMGVESTGKARDVAFSREDFTSLKVALHSGVQEKGTLGNVMLVRGFTKDARLGRNWG